MLRHALVVIALALVGCKSHQAAPPPPRVPVLPDTITGQLGTIGFALAIDLHALDLGKVAAMIPDDPPCVRDVLKSARVAAVTQSAEVWQGYLTGLSEPALRDCLTKFAPLMGLSVRDHSGGGFELALPGKPAVFQWRGDLAVITEGVEQPHAGDPPGVIFDLVAKVPRGAKGWLVASGFPAYKIQSAVAWLETDTATWTFTVLAEGSAVDAARPWVASIIDGFKAAAVQKGVSIDDHWFTIESTAQTAKLVARIPIAAFDAPAK